MRKRRRENGAGGGAWWCARLLALDVIWRDDVAHELKPSKVKLLQEEVEYLGHISTPQGIKITPGQRDAIIKMPYPLDSEGAIDETRLRSFIGLANFSRRYISNFAMHAYLLNGLLRKGILRRR